MFNEDVLKEFIFDCRIRKLRERTIKPYRNNNLALFRFIVQEYGVTEVEEINFQMINGYICFMSEKKLSEVYINTIVRTFKAYFRYATEEKYILHNPIDKVKRQKEAITLINTFNNEEVSRMVKYYTGSSFLQVRNQLIMALLFDTGIRNLELCYLKTTDIRETYINIFGKGKIVRHVPITQVLNKYLIKYSRVRAYYIKDKISLIRITFCCHKREKGLQMKRLKG